MSVPKILEITYEIYQGLSKRRLCKKYVGRSQQCLSLICAEILPLHALPSSSPE